MGTMRLIKVLDKNATLVVKDTIILGRGKTFKINDWRGQTLFQIDSNGNMKLKGNTGKM